MIACSAARNSNIRAPLWVINERRSKDEGPLSTKSIDLGAVNGGPEWPRCRKRYAVRRRSSPERVSGFSDGVFAVLITVLVFNLRPPELPTFGALL